MSKYDGLKLGFLACHKLLVQRIEPTGLIIELISRGVISMSEKEMILKEGVPSFMTDKLLTLLHRKAAFNPAVYEEFLLAMEEEETLKSAVDDVRAAAVMDEAYSAAVLKAHEHTIVAGLTASDILPELVSEGVVSPEENEFIREGESSGEQAKRLLKIVRLRGLKGFLRFKDALLNSESQQQLGRLLSRSVEAPDDKQYVEETLKQGHVPPRQSVYIERRDTIERLRQSLRTLGKREGWLVVHGMAGFGKTVLAAEAVRDSALLWEAFPGGVNWLTVGQMADARGRLDESKLLTRMQNLIVRLDEKGQQSSSSRPGDLESARDYLQKVISEQHPGSLLILDDVWTSDVARHFAVRCRTMVTTRNAAIADAVQTPFVDKVSISEGFSDEEARQMLSLWSMRDLESLPPAADSIVHYCRGSPMALALIGANLRKGAARDVRWKQIADKLEASHGAVDIKLLQPEWNYQHPTLKASIDLSVEGLSSELRSLFDLLVVFDYDTLVPLETLATLWDLDTFDADIKMTELVEQSLAQLASVKGADSDLIFYTIHDLVIDYLRGSIPQPKRKDYHSLLVQRFRKACGDAFHNLTDDHYVYQRLVYHVAMAEDWELLGQILSSLKWVMAAASHADGYSVLSSYQEFSEKVTARYTLSVQQFYLFVCDNMELLVQSLNEDEVLQVALLLPETNEVHLQAKGVARFRKKSWYTWSNIEKDRTRRALRLKLHMSGVRRCQFSQDGKRAVSCSNSGDVKLWETSTGMVLTTFSHDDQVSCCALSTSGKFIVSCSEDNTVKVWDIGRKIKAVDFKKHTCGVQCCAISPNDVYILSGDIDAHIFLWQLSTGVVRKKWLHGTPSTPTPTTAESRPFPDPVQFFNQDSSSSQEASGVIKSCAFTPDGQSVVTATGSGSVKLWNLNGEELKSYVGHIAEVPCVVFNKDGSRLATASQDRTVKVWATQTGEIIADLAHKNNILCCAFSPADQMLLSGDVDGQISSWSLQRTEGPREELHLFHDFVSCVVFSPNGKRVIAAADNGIVILSDIQDLFSPLAQDHYRRRFSAHFLDLSQSSAVPPQYIPQRSAMPQYTPLMTCFDEKLKRLQVLQGVRGTVVVPEVPAPPGVIARSWCMSGDCKHLFVSYRDSTTRLYSLKQSTSVTQLGTFLWDVSLVWALSKEDLGGEVVKCLFSPDGAKILVTAPDTHKCLSLNGQLLGSVPGESQGVRVFEFFHDSTRIASVCRKEVVVWSLVTPGTELRCQGLIQSEKDSILCVDVSRDDRSLVASATNGGVMVWDTTSGACLLPSQTRGRSACARSCCLSPDGSIAAAGFDDGSLKIWHISPSREIGPICTSSSYWIIDIAFSPDGTKIVTLCDSVQWWDTEGQELKKVLLKGTYGKFVKFSPDFSTFITIDNAGMLYVLTAIHEE